MRSILRPIIILAILSSFGWYIYNNTQFGSNFRSKNTVVVIQTGDSINNSGNSLKTDSGDQQLLNSIDSLLETETTGLVTDFLVQTGGDINLSGAQSGGNQVIILQNKPIEIFAQITGSMIVNTGDSATGSDQVGKDYNSKSDSEDLIGFRKGVIIGKYKRIENQVEIPTNTGSQIQAKPVPILATEKKTIVEENNIIKKSISCKTPWGTQVKHSDYTLAFKQSNGGVCEFEKRYCYQGNLQGSFVSNTCHLTNKQGVYLFKGQKSQSLDELIKNSNQASIGENYNLFERDTKLESQTMINSQNNQIIGISSKDKEQGLSIGIQPIKMQSGVLDEKLLTERNPNNNGSFHSSKQPQQRSNTILVSSAFKEVYQNDINILKGGNCTTPRGQILGDGQSTLAFAQSDLDDGLQCRFETRYCTNGKLAGTYQYPSCNRTSSQSYQASCIIGNRTIPHGGVYIAAQKPVAKNGEKCIYEARYCNDGVLQGNYQYPDCSS